MHMYIKSDGYTREDRGSSSLRGEFTDYSYKPRSPSARRSRILAFQAF